MKLEIITHENIERLHFLNRAYLLQQKFNIVNPILIKDDYMTEINQVILPNEKFVFLQNDANQIKGIMQYRTYEPKEYESSDITNLFQNFSSKEKNSELIYKKLKLNKYTLHWFTRNI